MELLGAPKSGFKLSAEVAPTSITLSSRLDPALLYLVVGAAVLLGLFGAALAAPARVVLEAGLFAALFSPIALFLVISALRLRATCVIDLAADEVRLLEVGYFGQWERRYRLEDVGSVLMLSSPPAGFLGAARSYFLCISLPDAPYRLAESQSEQSLTPLGRLLAEFLGVPLKRHEQEIVTAGRRSFLIGLLLYAIPVTAAIALLSLSIPERGSGWVFPTIMVAIVLSQVGAILTLLYYRRRVPDAPTAAELRNPAGAESPVPVAPPDHGP